MEILAIAVGFVGIGVTLAAWMYPDFRHWLLPRFGLRSGLFDLPTPPASTPETSSIEQFSESGQSRQQKIGCDERQPEERQIQKISCPLCKASGNKWGAYETPCHKCNGRGYIYTFRFGQPNCLPCKGTGCKNAAYEAECPICGGVGLMPYEVDE